MPNDVQIEILYCGIELIGVNEINNAFECLEKGNVKYRFVIDMAGLKN